MKPSEVSVSVSDFGGEIFVHTTFKLRGHELERECACPDPLNADATKHHKRVKESSRKAKAKQLKKAIEGMEFPDA